MKRRIFLSSPRDDYLDDRRANIKLAIIMAIEELGFEVQAFGTARGGKGLAAGTSWSATEADRIMQQCVGALVLGFPLWDGTRIYDNLTFSLVTEYCQYE